jgi:hypothetical protein
MSNFDNFFDLLGDSFSFIQKTIKHNNNTHDFEVDTNNEKIFCKQGQILNATKCPGGIKIQLKFEDSSSNYYVYKVSPQYQSQRDRMVAKINNLNSQTFRRIKLISVGYSTEILSWE